MKYVIEAGTDAALLLIFDPLSLPEDFDSIRGGTDIEVLKSLHREGRLFFTGTDGDGSYLLHVFVNEVPAESLSPYLHDCWTSNQFRVRSGRIYFAGAEYVFRTDDKLLRRYPRMGGSFLLPNGTYEVNLWRTEYPDGLHEESFYQECTLRERTCHSTFNFLALISECVIIGVIGAFFCLPVVTWLICAFPFLTIVVLPICMNDGSLSVQ